MNELIARGDPLDAAIGALIGALIWLIGGIDPPIEWLATFTLIDYILGNICAIKLKKWSSSAGFRGVCKKVSIFVIVAICHGLDQVLGVGLFRSAGIIAYSVIEAGSILENLKRLKVVDHVPTALQNGIKEISDREKKSISSEDKSHDNLS